MRHLEYFEDIYANLIEKDFDDDRHAEAIRQACERGVSVVCGCDQRPGPRRS